MYWKIFFTCFYDFYSSVYLNSKFELLCTQVLILLIDGDIESNPGPTFEILKVVQGSFHEGNAKFGYTAAV